MDSVIEQRLNLRKTQYLCERFEKSPGITEKHLVTSHLSICYGKPDESAIASVSKLFLNMYAFVKDWFDYRGDIAIELWMAPAVADLQYMTCMPCGEGYACAPGIRNGVNIILLDSPLSGGKNADKSRLSAILAHEITHHFVGYISRSTPFTMKRKENHDVPMWLEEGLAMLIMTDVTPNFQAGFVKDIFRADGYSLEDMWNDLAGCEDQDKAYLQAYKETKALVKRRGKAEIIRLLYLNRTHFVNWNDLPAGGEVKAKARYTNDGN